MEIIQPKKALLCNMKKPSTTIPGYVSQNTKNIADSSSIKIGEKGSQSEKKDDSQGGTTSITHVWPSVETIGREICTQVLCPVEGCGKIVAQSSALRLHLIKKHHIIKTQGDEEMLTPKKSKQKDTVLFHCPQEKCMYHYKDQRHFTSLKNLRQHYMKMHAEKKYECAQCGKCFGLERDCRRHSKTCNDVYVCPICSASYTSREAYLSHCLRVNHPVMESAKREQSTFDGKQAEPRRVVTETVSQTAVIMLPQSSPKVHHDKPKTIPIHKCDSGKSKITQTAMKHPLQKMLPAPNVMLIPVNITANIYMPSDQSGSVVQKIVTTPATNAPVVLIADTRPTIPKIHKGLHPIKPYPAVIHTPIPIVPRVEHNETVISTPLLTVNVNSDEEEYSRNDDQIFCDISLTDDEIDMSKTCASTQTLLAKEDRTVAQTQTSGDFILKSAMESADIPIRKESRASQVSPRAKVKRDYREMQTSHTQTASSHANQGRTAKRRRKSRIGECQTITTSLEAQPPAPLVSPSLDITTSPSNVVGTMGVWPTDMNVTDTETQTMAFLNSLAESISTQTLESFLAGSQADENLENLQVGINDYQSCPTPGRLHLSTQTMPNNTLGTFENNQTAAESNSLDGFDLALASTSQNPAAPCDIGFVTDNDTMQTGAEISVSHTSTGTDPMFPDLFDELPDALMDQSSVVDVASTQATCDLVGSSSSLPPQSADNMASSLLTSAMTDIAQNSIHMETQTFSDIFTTSTTQTTDLETACIHMETQTAAENMFDQLLTNMQTQTTEPDDFLSTLNFSDIETQTPQLVLQLPQAPPTSVVDTSITHAETQTQLNTLTAIQMPSESTDMQTQTFFSNLEAEFPSSMLTDSHTQTNMDDLMMFMKTLN